MKICQNLCEIHRLQFFVHVVFWVLRHYWHYCIRIWDCGSPAENGHRNGFRWRIPPSHADNTDSQGVTLSDSNRGKLSKPHLSGQVIATSLHGLVLAHGRIGGLARQCFTRMPVYFVVISVMVSAHIAMSLCMYICRCIYMAHVRYQHVADNWNSKRSNTYHHRHHHHHRNDNDETLGVWAGLSLLAPSTAQVIVSPPMKGQQFDWIQWCMDKKMF